MCPTPSFEQVFYPLCRSETLQPGTRRSTLDQYCHSLLCAQLPQVSATQPTCHNRQTSRLTTHKTQTYASCCVTKTYTSCCAVKTTTIASCHASQDQEEVQGREEERKTATSAQLPVMSVLP